MCVCFELTDVEYSYNIESYICSYFVYKFLTDFYVYYEVTYIIIIKSMTLYVTYIMSNELIFGKKLQTAKMYDLNIILNR